MADAGVRTGIVRDTERNVNGRPLQLFLRIYEPDTAPGIPEKRALLVLIPPAMGSLMTVDRLCGELSQRGFTVLTYSRKGIDSPAIGDTGKKLSLSPARNIRLLKVIFQGTGRAAANKLGRALEEERKQDLIFLLTSLKNRGGAGNLLTENTDQEHVFIAGFGAGGAAALSLAASPGFTAAYPAVQGIIGLECPILSALGQEPVKSVGISREEAGWWRFFWADLGTRIANLGPRKVKGIENPPLPEVPAFYILSDRALYAQRRENRYMSIQESFRRGTSPAALAMVPGAGPLDYSDVPEKYPLLSLLFSGDTAPVWAREDYLGGTASLIINFAAALDTGVQVFHRTVLDRRISIDTNRAWNLTAAEYILGL
jgi:dienelactone hydrolase